MEKEKRQIQEINNFKEKFKTQISSDTLERFMRKAAELGKKLELRQIKKDLVEDILMKQINFSDPQNIENLLPLLPEFIFYCSSRDSVSGTLESLKTIPISNFKNFLLKIIDCREADSIDNILREVVSLIFILDEQNEGASATVNAMKFACDLVKDCTDSQYEVVLGIRLMAVLINSRFVPEESVLHALNPAKFQEPYIRVNQYIAIREILSRAVSLDDRSDCKIIPYQHQIFTEILNLLTKVKLRNSYEKFEIMKAANKKGKNVKKWNNIIIIMNNNKEIEEIYELDQWVQCQYISLIPYIYYIEKERKKVNISTRYLDKNNLEELKKLSWNVRFNYLLMLKSSKSILTDQNDIIDILIDLYLNSDENSDFQTTCISTIIELLKSNENAENEQKKNKIIVSVKMVRRYKKTEDNSFIESLIESAGNKLKKIAQCIKENNEEAKFKLELNFIFKIIPIFTSLIIYFASNKKCESYIDKILELMNQVPVNYNTNCSKIFLDPFFINVAIHYESKKKEIYKTADKALHFLLISTNDFEDHIFFIDITNKFFDSNAELKKIALSFLMDLIDIISKDPVYKVRDLAVQTVLKFLPETTFSDVLDYVQQIFPGSSFSGKKSLLSLIGSIIASIDPFDNDEKSKDLLFTEYFDPIFLLINDSQNKDLKKFFKDMLKSIWTLLPEHTKKELYLYNVFVV